MPTNDPHGEDQYPRGSRGRPRQGRRDPLEGGAPPEPEPPAGRSPQPEQSVEEARRAYDDKSR
ncbi:MAG: hypothetical protein JO341_08195 [Gammaproteobacteria bacterium]|nr:hypothetical protein [Gammaproteobacteria bacterium]MBV9620991.1 hypothetical protein [Gammaproteobacteria bacterium]